jgi:hypothetical protein
MTGPLIFVAGVLFGCLWGWIGHGIWIEIRRANRDERYVRGRFR